MKFTTTTSNATATATTSALLVALSATALLASSTRPLLLPSVSAFSTSSSSSSSCPHLITRPLAPPSNNNNNNNNNNEIQPTPLQKLSLRLGFSKHLRERVVHSYFHGVDTKNIPQICACFAKEGAIIRDVCNLKNHHPNNQEKDEEGTTLLVGKLAMPHELGERCNEFLGAHPDCRVMFHYGPTCGRGRTNKWVYAHWYEEGTFSGHSQGITPDHSPLNVQGQTRFLVDDDLKIREIVITRTFSVWEEKLIKKTMGMEEENA